MNDEVLSRMKKYALNDLKKKGFSPDSVFEYGLNRNGDCWVGIYARPEGTPTYGLDEGYKDGNDYAEWFEWFEKEIR